MLHHFSKSGEKIPGIERTKKINIDQNGACRRKNADFILQTPKVNSGFTSRGSIYGTKQGSGDVDVTQSPLKGGRGKPTNVGNHSTSQINHQRFAGGAIFGQQCPDFHSRVNVLMIVAVFDGDYMTSFSHAAFHHFGQAKLFGMFIC